jgi:hypothetical protein
MDQKASKYYAAEEEAQMKKVRFIQGFDAIPEVEEEERVNMAETLQHSLTL